MKITIYGAGKTGRYLTRSLTSEGHDVTVIEASGSVCNKLQSLYDISVIESRGIKKDVFTEEQMGDCDLFIAVGPVDEMNILACSVSKKVGADRTIARIRNEDLAFMENMLDLETMGIDMVIHPEKELSRELVNLVTHPNATDVYELYGGQLLIVSTIVKENSLMVGKSLIEISKLLDLSNLRVVVVEEGPHASIPKGDYIVKANDKIYAIAVKELIRNVFEMAGYTEKKNKDKDIMINGSGKIARSIAEELEKAGHFKTKLIVGEEDEATELSEHLHQSLVVHGEATDIDILAAEGIIDMDFFLALTDNDEINMVSSLLANHLQVQKTITLIEKTDYLPITKTIGLQRCINSSISSANAIMRFASHGNVLASSTLKGLDVEFISFKVRPDNRLIDRQLHEIKFPKNSMVGTITREGVHFVPSGKNKIQANDEVVIFTEKTSVPEIHKMFGG